MGSLTVARARSANYGQLLPYAGGDPLRVDAARRQTATNFIIADERRRCSDFMHSIAKEVSEKDKLARCMERKEQNIATKQLMAQERCSRWGDRAMVNAIARHEGQRAKMTAADALNTKNDLRLEVHSGWFQRALVDTPARANRKRDDWLTDTLGQTESRLDSIYEDRRNRYGGRFRATAMGTLRPTSSSLGSLWKTSRTSDGEVPEVNITVPEGRHVSFEMRPNSGNHRNKQPRSYL